MVLLPKQSSSRHPLRLKGGQWASFEKIYEDYPLVHQQDEQSEVEWIHFEKRIPFLGRAWSHLKREDAHDGKGIHFNIGSTENCQQEDIRHIPV